MKTTQKSYTMTAYSMKTLLKIAARGHTKYIAAKKKMNAAEPGSYVRESYRAEKEREWYHTSGIIFALSMLDGTAKQKRQSRAFLPKSTQTRKATA